MSGFDQVSKSVTPDSGLLHDSGYKVGHKGLPAEYRRNILTRVFKTNPIPEFTLASNVAEWGFPKSSARLRTCMLDGDGQVVQAKESLSQALALEPECAFAHSRGNDIHLAPQDFKAVRDSMQILEAKAGHDFKGNLTDEIWKDFLKAPESEPWR